MISCKPKRKLYSTIIEYVWQNRDSTLNYPLLVCYRFINAIFIFFPFFEPFSRLDLDNRAFYSNYKKKNLKFFKKLFSILYLHKQW